MGGKNKKKRDGYYHDLKGVRPYFCVPCETHAAEFCSLERFWVPLVQLPSLLDTSTANKVVRQADNREEVNCQKQSMEYGFPRLDL